MIEFQNTFSDWHDWDGLIEAATRLRHYLHQHPELGYEEENTAKIIRLVLDGAHIEWTAYAGTGTVAIINGAKDGQHIAFRGDIDALPILEEGEQVWRSTLDGKMHACGHDGHTVTLLAAALWMNKYKDHIDHPVSFLFQPAEEGLHGAQKMIEGGALSGIDMIYGWHNWPSIPFGKAVCPDGAVMSANGSFEITITGRGGHSSQPELCRDPILAASAITLNLQQIVSRKIAPQTAAVLSVTSIEAQSNLTVIPEHARLGGTIRVSNTADRDTIFGLVKDITEDTAAAYGVTVQIDLHPRYGATVNHADNAQNMRDALEQELGGGWHDDDIAIPIMASEDFSYYLQQIPGAFALIGADDGKPEHQKSCHSPHYDFNDRLIPVVVCVFARLAGAPLPKL